MLEIDDMSTKLTALYSTFLSVNLKPLRFLIYLSTDDTIHRHSFTI